MSELAHGAMLIGALGGAACAAAGRRTALDLAASAAMLAAMADMALTRIVAPLQLDGGARRPRHRARGSPPSRSRRARNRTVATSAFARAAPGARVHRRRLGVRGRRWRVRRRARLRHPLHADAGAGGVLFLAAVLAMTAFGGWLVAVEFGAHRPERSARPDRALWASARHAAEAASTTVMLAAMAVPGVLAALA